MTDTDKAKDDGAAPQDSGASPPAEPDRKEEMVHRERREAASSLQPGDPAGRRRCHA